MLEMHDNDSTDLELLDARETQAAQELESESEDGLLNDGLPRHAGSCN